MTMNVNCEMRCGGVERRTAASDRGAPERSAWLRAELPLQLRPLGTPLGRIARSVIRDGVGGEASLKNPKINCTSCATSNFSLWGRSIRKNIIGHGMCPRRERFIGLRRFRSLAKPLRVIDQQARQHRARTLLDPLVNEYANLLAEIGGMCEARKLVALKRITRSREKKLPRRLGWGTGHVSLLDANVCKVIHQ